MDHGQQIKELYSIIYKLINEVESLKKINAELRQELEKYRTPRNSSNSSKPPSSDFPKIQKTQSLRTPSGKSREASPVAVAKSSHDSVSSDDYRVIMERYQITTHKESGIRNDPNDWATGIGKPRYILDLLLSIINVSVQTVEIIEGLPKVPNCCLDSI